VRSRGALARVWTERFGRLWRVDGVEAVRVSNRDEATRLVRSFDAFFETEYRGVVAFAAAICGRRVVAEELAQEAFFAAFSSVVNNR
jgi:hypothetical protein